MVVFGFVKDLRISGYMDSYSQPMPSVWFLLYITKETVKPIILSLAIL